MVYLKLAHYKLSNGTHIDKKIINLKIRKNCKICEKKHNFLNSNQKKLRPIFLESAC